MIGFLGDLIPTYILPNIRLILTLILLLVVAYVSGKIIKIITVKILNVVGLRKITSKNPESAKNSKATHSSELKAKPISDRLVSKRDANCKSPLRSTRPRDAVTIPPTMPPAPTDPIRNPSPSGPT